MLPRHLALILDGQFEQAGMERPRMYVGDRVTLARRTIANTGFVFGEDPRVLAAELSVVVSAGPTQHCGGEMVRPGVVSVRADLTRRERGLRLFHALAHELLIRDRWEHTHGDAWMLTFDLAIPPRTGALFDAAEIVRAAHIPEAVAEKWLAVSARFGRRAASEEAA